MKSFVKYLAFFIIAALFGAAGIKGFEYFKNQNNDEETKIINEIKTNEPAKTTSDSSEKTTVINEIKTKEPAKTASSSQQLIELYYNRLADGDLEKAYTMKKYMKTPFSTFEGWYKNLKSTEFLDFIEVAPNQFDFIVELENNDGSKEKYRVVMQVEGNMLNTISSVSTNEKPELRFVYGEDGDITTLFLGKNGEKTTIETAKKSKNEKFNNVEITTGGDYLIYFKTGDEWNNGKIYDIAKNQVVHDIGPSKDLDGFTQDFKHFYSCLGSGLFGGDINVFAVPSFALEKNLILKDALVFSCDGYDKKTNILKYTLSINGFQNPKSYSYNFSSAEVSTL